jgi:hypothetical protein
MEISGTSSRRVLQQHRGIEERVKPTRSAVWQAENEPVIDGGNPPRPFRHLRVAEHRTPDRVYESSPRSFGVGSKIGYHHHQPGRPALNFDARERCADSQEGEGKKMAVGLLGAGSTLGYQQSKVLILLPDPPGSHPERRRDGERVSDSRKNRSPAAA